MFGKTRRAIGDIQEKGETPKRQTKLGRNTRSLVPELVGQSWESQEARRLYDWHCMSECVRGILKPQKPRHLCDMGNLLARRFEVDLFDISNAFLRAGVGRMNCSVFTHK